MNPVKLVAGGMIAMAAAFGFGRFVYTPILPHMLGDGLTPSAAGLIAGANYLGYLAGALAGVTGVMQRRARVWFVGSVAVSGLTMIGMALTRNVILQSILRFVGGAGGAVVMVAGATLVFGALIGARRAWYGIAPFVGVGLGIAISSLIVSVMGHAGATWQAMWLVTGLLATIATVPVFFLVPDATIVTPARATGGGAIVWSRRLVLLSASYGLFGFGYVITATFIVVITRETPALAPVEPYVWAVVGLAGAASIPFWSAVAQRLGDVRTYALGCVTEAVGVALSVVAPTPVTIVLSAAFVGGTFMAITAIGLQIGRALSGGAPQRIQALMTALFGVGQVIGPLIAGHLRETTGTFVATSLAATTALVVGAALALIP